MDNKGTHVGTIKGMYRYPVKSFAGERLARSKVEKYGIYGDREYAFVDESKQGHARFITARQFPQMLTYNARLEEAFNEGDRDKLIVTAQDGSIFHWNSLLLNQIQGYTERKISMLRYDNSSSALLGVDAESVLLVNEASVKHLEKALGEPVDPRRFRANLYITLHDDAPFLELDWVGKSLIAGDVELQVVSPCERCSLITLDPDTLQKNNRILNEVVRHWDGQFGVYASVQRTGTIQEGDLVYLKG